MHLQRFSLFGFLYQIASAQLAAGPVNIAAHFPPDRCVDAAALQRFLKGLDLFTARSCKVPLFDRIDRNQIYMAVLPA